MNIVVIIPTYNEADNIKKFLEEVEKSTRKITQHKTDLLVVDDNSPDGTGKTVKKLQKEYQNLHLLSGERHGLGQAYLRGMDYALGKLNADVVFEIDADFQHDPKTIPQFIKQIDDGYDFIIGSRYIPGGSIPINWGITRKFFSIVGNLIVRTSLLNYSIHDWTSGYRAIKTWVYRKVRKDLETFNGYTFQVAFLNMADQQHAKITEIPIQFGERKYGKSKIGEEYVKNLLIYLATSQVKKYQRFIKFGIVGFIGYVINAFFLYVFSKGGYPEWAAWAGSTELAIISNFIFNNIWTFKTEKIVGIAKIISKFLQFNMTSAGALVIQTVFGTLGVNFFGEHNRQLLLPFIIVFLVLPYNYFMYNRVVWQTHKSDKHDK